MLVAARAKPFDAHRTAQSVLTYCVVFVADELALPALNHTDTPATLLLVYHSEPAGRHLLRSVTARSSRSFRACACTTQRASLLSTISSQKL